MLSPNHHNMIKPLRATHALHEKLTDATIKVTVETAGLVTKYPYRMKSWNKIIYIGKAALFDRE